MIGARPQVSIVRCPDYNSARISESLKRGLDHLGGLEKFFKPTGRIFVKINHLSPGSSPERCIVTHPSFAKEVLRLLKDLEMKITVGDDIQPVGREGFLMSGYLEMCRELDIPLINLKSERFREVPCPEGYALKSVFVSNAVLDSDYILNLPKLKTHSLTAFTGAVKNLFGVIPCGQRLDLHKRFPKNEDFSQALVDIFSCVPPHLTIMDGIMAMEGPGPSAGIPRALGVVISSPDTIALDAVSSAVVGFRPEDVLSTKYARERRLGESRLEAVEILGEKLENVRAPDFKKPLVSVSFLRKKLPSAVYGYVSGQLILVPEVEPEACAGCEECFKACPASAIRMDRHKAFILKPKCIQCLCCSEVCRFNALRLRKRPLARLVHFLESGIHKKSEEDSKIE